MNRLIAAEWIKLWSLRSTSLVLLSGALVIIGITANSARSNVDLIRRSGSEEQRSFIDPMHAAFMPDAFQILMLIAGSVGAITIFGEYTSGLIRTTFAAIPARHEVAAAKIILIAAVMSVLGAAVAAASFGITQAIYGQEGVGMPFGAPGTARAIAASALLAPLSALVGMALGAMIRHATGTMVSLVGLLFLLPALVRGETYRWVAEIGNAMPISAWSALTDNPARPDHPAKYPVTLAEAWTVFGAWALVAVVVTVLVVRRRDV
ncbi:hypothetical protein ABGB12_12810 [Actinocorallia sp. B10E7]|uniref:hypothetical protein n=1 Tax=Actinocorallia sp. B10E7 TaxID=3153558 RepID=UPI00325CEC16